MNLEMWDWIGMVSLALIPGVNLLFPMWITIYSMEDFKKKI